MFTHILSFTTKQFLVFAQLNFPRSSNSRLINARERGRLLPASTKSLIRFCGIFLLFLKLNKQKHIKLFLKYFIFCDTSHLKKQIKKKEAENQFQIMKSEYRVCPTE